MITTKLWFFPTLVFRLEAGVCAGQRVQSADEGLPTQRSAVGDRTRPDPHRAAGDLPAPA